MSYINEALLDSKPYIQQRENAKNNVAKWEKTGLLEGMDKDEFSKANMATLLENQARQLIKEFSTTNPAANASVAEEEWSGVALPLVRRIFGSIAAQDFVSVQAMNLPSGLVFYLDFKYGTAVAGRTTSESLGGKTGEFSPSGSSAPFGEKGLYGVGRYGYSVSASSATIHLNTSTEPSLVDLNFDTEVSRSSANGEAVGMLHKVTAILTGSAVDKVDDKAVRSFNITTAITGSGVVLPQYTKLEGDTLTLIISSSAPIGITPADETIEYYKQPTAADRGDFEDKQGNANADTLAIPEVNLELKSFPIVAKTRKLKAVWTPELAQDLNAYHSVDAEAELTSMLSEYISMEIDLEILDMLISEAPTVEYWSARSGFDYSGDSFVSTSFTGTRFEWWQTLVAKIQKVSNEIHRLTLRGGANFVVVSPKIATILESLPGYMSNTDGNQEQFAMGVSRVGNIANRFTVYKNPYMTENLLLVGFRGSNFLETGAVYAPYVPLMMTPLVYDPSDFTPRKGVMTRYAKKMIRPEFYAKIFCDRLDLI